MLTTCINYCKWKSIKETFVREIGIVRKKINLDIFFVHYEPPFCIDVSFDVLFRDNDVFCLWYLFKMLFMMKRKLYYVIN